MHTGLRESDMDEGVAGFLGSNPDLDQAGATLQALFRHGSTTTISNSKGQSARTKSPSVLSNKRLSWNWPSNLFFEPERGYIEGYNSTYEFLIEDVLGAGEGFTSAFPNSITKHRHREFRRVKPHARMILRWRVDSSGESFTPVHDISYGGLTVDLCASDATPPDGSLLISAELISETDAVDIGSFQVHSCLHISENNLRRLRLKVRAHSDAQRRMWLKVVGSALHPNTKIAGNWTEKLWGLYDKCNYFKLSGAMGAQAFRDLKPSFAQFLSKLQNAPELGCNAVYPHRDNAVLASLSTLKVYSNTWMGFQLGKPKGNPSGIPGRSILRDVHLHVYEHIQSIDPEAKWIVSYIQAIKVWSRAVHHDFSRQFIPSGQADIQRVRAYAIDCERPQEDTKGCTTSDVSKCELALILQTIRAAKGEVYVDAFDLTSETFALDKNIAEWTSGGLERERKIFVVKELGQIKAAVVLELAEPGSHLFRLLDMARLFSLGPDGDSYFVTLLNCAARWYRSKARKSFVLFLEEGIKLDDEYVKSVSDLGLSDQIILSSKLIPELLECLHEVTAPRENLNAN